MPIHTETDSEGPYCQWGNHGKKYRYTSGSARGETFACKKAGRQAAAAHANGWHGDFKEPRTNIYNSTKGWFFTDVPK
jgi:hypothetical protein